MHVCASGSHHWNTYSKMHGYVLIVYYSTFFFASFFVGSKGYDFIEGGLPGIPCFKPRAVTGCSGTLMENYKPDVPFEGNNPPDTAILLFTRRNPEYAEFLHECGGRLPQNTLFDPSARTVVLVHGWIDASCRSAWMREMRDQFFIRDNYNVIIVDWTWGNGPDYTPSAYNARTVGYQLSFVIQNIMDQAKVPAQSFHLIGHSIGSHVCGFAGQKIPHIGRISGLDPASAPFIGAKLDDRLDPSDADLVDNIHTDGGSCAYQGATYGYPLGHADFYPNGGSVQFSCFPYLAQSLVKLDLAYAFESLLPVACYHFQSIQYFKVSINPCNGEFVGVECPDYKSFKFGRCRSCGEDGAKCAVMGLDFVDYDYPKDGKNHTYYLDTKLLCPYVDNSKINLQGFKVKDYTSKYCSTATTDSIKTTFGGGMLNG